MNFIPLFRCQAKVTNEQSAVMATSISTAGSLKNYGTAANRLD
ncbi:hypothetical protein [Anabaena sp. CCY 9614]